MYGTTGTLTFGLPAAGVALAATPVGAVLGRSVLVPRALPTTGGGGMALATVGHTPWPLTLAVIFLALWTLLMAGRVLLNLLPRAEA